MTTAHRPTFDPLASDDPVQARGKEALRGPAYHQRLLPAHTKLKFRQVGQGGDTDASHSERDLAAEVLAAEIAYFAKKKAQVEPALELQDDVDVENSAAASDALGKRHLFTTIEEVENIVAKSRRILEDTWEIDADNETEEEDYSDEDDFNEEADLQREMERVRSERDQKRRHEGEEKAREEQEARERNIALGNPLLNKPDTSVKRRWDDDVIFKNQALGAEETGKKKFVNDLLRSDFHRRFMIKYVR